METRNAQYNKFGGIDCEINHPVFGWIPSTLSEDDAETAGLFAQVLAAGNIAAYVPPQTPTQAEIDAQRKNEIMQRLKQIDMDSIRPLRAIATGNAGQYDHDKLSALDEARAALVEELAGLSA